MHKVDYPLPESQPVPNRLLPYSVYTIVLKCLLDRVVACLVNITGRDEDNREVDIILTHPNSLNDTMRSFLRASAIEAGLVSEEQADGCLHFIEDTEAAARYFLSKDIDPLNHLQVRCCRNQSRHAYSTFPSIKGWGKVHHM